MQIGCSLRSLDVNLADGLALASSAGFTHVELDWEQIERQGLGHARDTGPVAALLREHSLSLGAVCTGTVSAERIDQSRLQVKRLKGILEKIKSLSCNLAVITGGKRTLENFNALAALLSEVTPVAEQLGVTIAVSNKHGSRIEARRDLLALFLSGRSTRAGICIDTHDFHLVGIRAADIIGDHPNQIKLVRVSDVMGTIPVALGRGEIAMKEMVARLRQLSYNGLILVDNFPPAGPERMVGQLRRAREYLEALIK